MAVTEYSADASLSSAKFASWSLASTITSRCLFRLRGWKADAKAKWKLTAAPYKAPTLFGAALESVLVQDKDKRKILPSSYQRTERRYAPYSQRQPFRPTSTSTMERWSLSDHLSTVGIASRTDSSFVTGAEASTLPRLYRGSGYKPFRRGK